MPKQLLVVEDHDFQRRTILSLLNMLPGLDAYGISNAEDALQMIKCNAPDVIICDLNMPGLDGISLLRILGESNYSGEVIISSAVDDVVLKASGRMCEAYNMKLLGALNKPISKQSLQALLYNEGQLKSVPAPTHSFDKKSIVEGLNLNQFILHYQPQIKLRTGEWVQSEALIRWQHPEYGLQFPGSFLPELTHFGLGTQLTKFIIEQVINDKPMFGHRSVAINIGSKELLDQAFIDYVIALLDEHPTLVDYIKFELTETDIIENIGFTLCSAIRLCMRGFELSIDDFGTGYSSMMLLDDMPFSELKIDLSFVQKMLTNKRSNSIVEASLFLADKLNMMTVAEGIEDFATLKHLAQISDGLGQGYFISKPISVDLLNTWHKQWQQRWYPTMHESKAIR
ncbi:EAL domain-containing response regulator [Aliivibrio kagoshimensis]|uniref:EAL domain-containing response regulator n=1 Tax=Aliivibrio kagoshimensis TaxID=2910230 RepID=UPI003D0BE6C9